MTRHWFAAAVLSGALGGLPAGAQDNGPTFDSGTEEISEGSYVPGHAHAPGCAEIPQYQYAEGASRAHGAGSASDLNCSWGACNAGGHYAQGSGCQNGKCGKKCHGCHHGPKHGNRAALYRASLTPWHGDYNYTQWGAPVALVVPPTAEYQTDYSWGVPSSRVSRINHQFQRPYPGNVFMNGYDGKSSSYGFLPTPQYPHDTNQFGVYYVRGPW